MKSELKKRLAQLQTESEKGIFGLEAQANSLEYLSLGQQNMDVFLKLINDFYNTPHKTEEDRGMAHIADMFCQLVIVVYREAKKQDEKVAMSFANAFIEDFPNAEGSCLYPQWEGLAKASFAFKSTPKTNNPLLVWQQSLKLVQAYNEFLNALLGYFLVGWRCALGKKYSEKTFSNAYGAKLNEFNQLTDGTDGAFALIFNIANYPLRNAIAHEDIWFDSESNVVRYSAGKNPKKEYQISLVDLLGYGAVGSHLGKAYIAAIATIIVLEDGLVKDKVQIPSHLMGVFNYTTEGG